MLIRGVVKFCARNCPGINFRKVGNYGYDAAPCAWSRQCLVRAGQIIALGIDCDDTRSAWQHTRAESKLIIYIFL